MQRYLLLIFIISFTFFACKPKKGTEEGIKLNIFVSKITENKIPKELIEYLLPFSDKKDINFVPTLSRLDINFFYEIKVNEFNAGLSLATSARQKKLRGIYENLVLPDSLSIKKQNENGFTKQEYLKKLGINQTDSTFIFLIGKNQGFELLKDDKSKVRIIKIENIDNFRKSVSEINKNNKQPNIVLFYNLTIKLKVVNNNKLTPEQIKDMLASEKDSLNKNVDTLEKSKDNLLAEIITLREQLRQAKTDQSKDVINEQIIIRNNEIQAKNAEIYSLRNRVTELEKELKKEKEENLVLQGKIADLEKTIANADEATKIKIQKQIDELEAQKKGYEEQQKKDQIQASISRYIESGKIKTEDIKFENSKIQIYTENKKGQKQRVTFNVFESRVKALKSQKLIYKQSICENYGKAYNLAKQHNIMLDEVLREIEVKRQIYAKLCKETDEEFEGGISNGSPESWIKTCK